MITDPIANFLTRLRNASKARQESVTIRSSRMLRAIADVLVKRGLVNSVRLEKRPARGNGVKKEVEELTIELNLERPLLQIRRVSKPGQRIYTSASAIKPVKRGLGTAIISTSKGILPDSDARKQKLGGEYICEIY